MPHVHILDLLSTLSPALRVDWFREWAAKQRTDEEVNLLYADARATCRGFEYTSRVHRDHANPLPEYASRGATTYALEKADMYQRMSEKCGELVEAAHQTHRTHVDDEHVEVWKEYLPVLNALKTDDLDHTLVRGDIYSLIL